MSMSTIASELILNRLLDAPADKLFRCWTTPDLLKQWFAPKPYTTPIAELDVRPGGSCNIVMRSPDGQDMPCPSTYLEIVQNRKIVSTDAFYRRLDAESPKCGRERYTGLEHASANDARAAARP